MSYNTLLICKVLTLLLWALSGVMIIIRYLEHNYLMVGFWVGLMVVNAISYSLYKRILE